MTALTGIITTIAGTPGVIGYSGDTGPATSAQFTWTAGIVLDSSGNLYVSDIFNGAVRRVDATTGIITTFAEVMPGASFQMAGLLPMAV